MKKVVLVAAAAAFALSACLLAGCQKSEPAPEPAPAPEPGETEVVGGWENYDSPANPCVLDAPYEWNAIIEGTDCEGLDAIALLGTQVVSGVNTMSVAQDAQDNWYFVQVYTDADGKSEVSSKVDFDYTRYMDPEAGDLVAEELCGGWTVCDGIGDENVLPAEAADALKAAVADMTGATYEPVALLGTQVVAGVNYAILCKVTPVVPDAVSAVAVVTVYAGVDGGAEILSVNGINFAGQPR